MLFNLVSSSVIGPPRIGLTFTSRQRRHEPQAASYKLAISRAQRILEIVIDGIKKTNGAAIAHSSLVVGPTLSSVVSWTPVIGRGPSANQFYFASGFELIMAAPPEQCGLWPTTNDE